MKILKYKILIICLIGFGLFTINSCTDRLEEINENPNDPEIVPTNMIFNGATRYLMHYTRDGWWSARMTLPWMQYSGQRIYQEEDRYQYRESQTNNGWYYLYKTATDLKSIIDLCEDEETRDQMGTYGNLDNQVAVSRIMLVYIFDQLATHFGDVPYWSYSNDDPEFQALNIDETMQPKYASQEKIFKDLLSELKLAAAQLNEGEAVFSSGDNIYSGNATKWKKFANSLRLRIANRIKDVYPEANGHISEAIADGVFESNEDSAIQAFGLSSSEGSPFWQTFMVGRRQDFVTGQSFVELLKGNSDTEFAVDPRLPKMVAPIGYTAYEVEDHDYVEATMENIELDEYVGMPSGLPSDLTSSNSENKLTSYPSFHVIKPDFGEVMMGYPEVQFILSEINGWSQAEYEEGVRASMEKWGVEENDINNFMADLPPANEENVLTQKYVALFMQPQEAWNEYRRTGFPNTDVLLLPGENGTDIFGETYTMTPLRSGNVTATDIPDRVRYPLDEQTLNTSNYQEAASGLSNGDEINSKLWWAD